MSMQEIRQVFEEELGPELREMRRLLTNIKRRLDFREEIDRIRLDTGLRRLEFLRESQMLEARITALEADKRQSA
jgi:hypothetical protein